MRIYSRKDVDRKALKGARICVLGYGSQGRAHALNLKDSGYDVVIGARKGPSWRKAKRDGLAVAEPARAVEGADLVAMLAPDLAQAALYRSVRPSLKKGATLLFAHGFNVHFRQIKPRKDLDVVLIAPKGPGDLVRRQYQQGRGVPCLIAIAQDATGKAHAKALAYADGIGGTRGGVLETTFAEETETDLFGEQAVYSVAELEADGHMPTGQSIFERQGLRWDPETLGYVPTDHPGPDTYMHLRIAEMRERAVRAWPMLLACRVLAPNPQARAKAKDTERLYREAFGAPSLFVRAASFGVLLFALLEEVKIRVHRRFTGLEYIPYQPRMQRTRYRGNARGRAPATG